MLSPSSLPPSVLRPSSCPLPFRHLLVEDSRAYARLFPPERTSSRAPSRRALSTTAPRCPSHLGASFPSCPCRSSPLRAAPRLVPVFVRRTRPWRASSSCGLRRRASGVAADRFRGPSSGLQVDFEHAWGRGTLPVDEDPGRETEGRGRDHGRRRAAGTGGRRWRYATTRRRDRPSSRWRSCSRRPTRRRPSGSTSRSRGASSRGSRRGAGRWRPSSAGSRRWPQGPTSCTWRCTRGKRRLLGTHLPAAWNRRRCPPVARVT